MAGRTAYEVAIKNALQAIQDAVEQRAAEPDVAFTETLTFNGAGVFASYEDFGDGWSEAVMAPDGYKGRVVGVTIQGVVETFTAVTTSARVDVGTSSDSDAYYVGGDIGAASASAPKAPVGTFVDFIPGGAEFLITGVAPTGGTPAGRSRCAVTIAWIKETA